MVSVGIVGASGYAGAIAAQLIDRHPAFELAYVTARAEAGMRLSDLHPRTRVDLTLTEFDPDAEVDAAIVGYPHGAAAPFIPKVSSSWAISGLWRWPATP